MKQIIPKQTSALAAGLSILAALALVVLFASAAPKAEAASGTAITFSDTAVTEMSAVGGHPDFTGGAEAGVTADTVALTALAAEAGNGADDGVRISVRTLLDQFDDLEAVIRYIDVSFAIDRHTEEVGSEFRRQRLSRLAVVIGFGSF